MNKLISSANSTQIGGSHYQAVSIQHWDFVWANKLDYFQGQITKYVTRWKKKNGVQDLHKARHFLQKYIELAEAAQAAKETVLDNAADTGKPSQEDVDQARNFRQEHAEADEAAEPGRGYINQD